MSNKIATGTEYKTIDWSELTILTRQTEQSGMSQIQCARDFTVVLGERDWFESHHVG